MIDLTLSVTKEMQTSVNGDTSKAPIGHLGTHFDVMNKDFPLSYTKRDGIFFDVSIVTHEDIDIKHIDINKIKKDMFIGFYSGYIEKVPYGTKEYFKNHPQLSNELIDALLRKKISIIGVDFPGVRRGKEHTPKDQYCADRGVFIIENMWNLRAVTGEEKVLVNTYPIRFEEMTGLPCRIIAEID